MKIIDIANTDREKKGLEAIIKFLEENGGKATEPVITKAMPFARATVQYRLTKLERAGILKRVKNIDGHDVNMNLIVLKGKDY